MIKLVECLRRKPSLTHQEFLDYWHDIHGPLVRSLAADLRMGRYVQCHSIEHPIHEFMRKRRGQSDMQPFDGFAEVWFESREVMESSYSTPAMKAANKLLREDEEHFLDWSGCITVFTEEKVVIE